MNNDEDDDDKKSGGEGCFIWIVLILVMLATCDTQTENRKQNDRIRRIEDSLHLQPIPDTVYINQSDTTQK